MQQVQQEQGKGLSEKKEWPELKGKDGGEAKSTIIEERPDLNVYIIQPGMVVTADVRFDRVRIYVDEDGKVARTPIIH